MPTPGRPAPSPPPAKPVFLPLSDRGKLHWNQAAISFAETQVRLAHHATETDPKVRRTSDDRANDGDAIRLLDAVRAAGITPVSMETRFRATGP